MTGSTRDREPQVERRAQPARDQHGHERERVEDPHDERDAVDGQHGRVARRMERGRQRHVQREHAQQRRRDGRPTDEREGPAARLFRADRSARQPFACEQ
ncbi:hypothetical protein KPA97_00035, partial [Burkholderia cenocepacia]|nr:hypothetical protein [Burkholderia cenocepacia]